MDIEKEVQCINPEKATSSDGNPPKIFKMSSEASADVLHNLFNVLKTEKSLQNYRPVSVLPGISSLSKTNTKTNKRLHK